MLTESEADVASQEMDEDDDEKLDEGPVVPIHREVINYLEDVCQFLEHEGHGSDAIVHPLIGLFYLKPSMQDKLHSMNTFPSDPQMYNIVHLFILYTLFL